MGWLVVEAQAQVSSWVMVRMLKWWFEACKDLGGVGRVANALLVL